MSSSEFMQGCPLSNFGWTSFGLPVDGLRIQLFSNEFRRRGHSVSESGIGTPQKFGESEVGAAIDFQSPGEAGAVFLPKRGITNIQHACMVRQDTRNDLDRRTYYYIT